jgi:hypothetical protein
MGAAFGIVPVGNHNQIKTELSENVHTVHPVQVMTDSVNFIYRQGEAPDSQGRGAGGNQASAACDTLS